MRVATLCLWLRPWLRPHARTLAAAAVLLAALAGLNVLPAIFTQWLIDGASVGHAGHWAAALIGTAVLQSVVLYAAQSTAARAQLGIVENLRCSLHEAIHQMDPGRRERLGSGALMSRLLDDASTVGAIASAATFGVLVELATVVGASCCLAARHPASFAAALSLAPLFVVLFHRWPRRIRTNAAVVRGRLDTIFTHLKEKLDGAATVKAFARGESEIAAFAARMNEIHQPRLDGVRLVAGFSNMATAAGSIGAIVVFAVGLHEAALGHMSPGAVLASAALAAMMFGPLPRIAELAARFEHAAASADRIREVFAARSKVTELENPVLLQRVDGNIEFSGAEYAYETSVPVLRRLDFRIAAGSCVAVVGPSGSGKSTMIDLLLRLRDPDHGEIRLDGVPIRNLSLQDLRSHIGAVPQETMILRGTLAENIALSTSNADLDRIAAAASEALLGDLVASLPDGLQTIVGEGGFPLSQSERQRVGIARAFCQQPSVVLMDEPASCIDPQSEEELMEAIDRLTAGRTSIVVTHRLEAARRADEILVMSAGRIVQQGTHDELFAESGGEYACLCRAESPRREQSPVTLPFDAASTSAFRPQALAA